MDEQWKIDSEFSILIANFLSIEDHLRMHKTSKANTQRNISKVNAGNIENLP
jgi:hypothetical protein